MNSTVRIVEPFPAKENPAKVTMASSSTTNQQLRFDPKFNNLPAPSDDRLDSGLDSYRSFNESCLSGGLENVEDAFQKLRLCPQSEAPKSETVQELEEEETREESPEESSIQLTADAFDQDQEGDT